MWRLRPAEFRRFEGLPFYATILPALRAIGGVMLTSEIAGVATAVFSVTHFHRLTLLGTLGNVAAMPFISFIVMPAGFLAVLLMPFGLDYYPLCIMGLGLEGTMAVARFVSSLGGDIVTGQMAAWVLPVSSLAFVLAILPHSRLFRVAGASLFAVTLALTILLGTARRPDMVIAETADLVGILSSNRLTINATRPASFIMDQWTRALAVKDLVKPDALPGLPLEREGARKPLTEPDEWKVEDEDAMEAAGKQVETGRFLCSGRDWCIGKLAEGLLVATFSDFASRMPHAGRPRSSSLRPSCASPHVSRARHNSSTAMRSGAAAHWQSISMRPEIAQRTEGSLQPTFRIAGALDGKDRPWLRHRYYNWRSDTYTQAFQPDQ